MSAVQPGTGTSKLAFNVLITGFSTKTEFVSQSLISAPPSTTLVPAFLAIRDTTLRTENAVKLQLSKSLMSAALPGTGINKYVFNVLTTGFSIETMFASLYLISALLSIALEHVYHATRATTSTMEDVSLPLFNKYLM